VAETVKCPVCGSEGESTAKNCTKCNVYIRSELECLRGIDASIKTIKGIAIWWLILSILSVIAALLYVLSRL
jgi:uncharacterized membrane protein